MNASLKGPLLTLVTILMWASLPLILQQILPVISPSTIVACRFAAAALILGLFLRARKRLPDPRLLLQNRWLILIGILGLVGNFWLFSTSLIYLSAAASQVLAQISPFILLFAGIVVLKEPLRKNQIIGAAILMFGILLFFNRELPQIFAGGANHQMLGITLSLLGCFSWAAYGLVQKMLLRRLTAPQILFVFYCGCALFAAPFANWSELGNLNGYQWLCLFYCCINTPIAYGAFAEALNHWEVGKVSTTITLVPLFTIAFAALAHWLVPAKFAAPDLNLLAALGAALVVTGAICSVLNRRMVRK